MTEIKEIISSDDMVSVVFETGERWDYIFRIPKSVPSGKILVHNNIRPRRRLGTEGFRAWLAEPSSKYEVCPCKWAPELGVHYRVRRSS